VAVPHLARTKHHQNYHQQSPVLMEQFGLLEAADRAVSEFKFPFIKKGPTA